MRGLLFARGRAVRHTFPMSCIKKESKYFNLQNREFSSFAGGKL